MTINPVLKAMTKEDIERYSHAFLMGHTKLNQFGFRLAGLNRYREKFGLTPLTREDSEQYRLSYIRSHYTYEEIHDAIFSYCENHKMNDDRWTGIELLDCYFGREYTRLFKALLGNHEYRKLAEQCRVKKLMETQIELYGGVGVGGEQTLKRSLLTRAQETGDLMTLFKEEGVLNTKSLHMSDFEKWAFLALIDRFGKGDVFYQYGIHPYDSRYPFNCDFYVKSRDLFIELNLHYSHGGHWFDPNNHDDQLRRKHLLQSDNLQKRRSIETWCDRDVQRRTMAQKNGLNYLVFWKTYGKTQYRKGLKCLADFCVWFYKYDCDTVRFLSDFPQNSY